MGSSWPRMEDEPLMGAGCTAPLPSHPKPMVEGHARLDRQKDSRAQRPRGRPHDCLGLASFLRENHPRNQHDSYRERTTWNRYQKQHFKDGLSTALGRPTATAPECWLRALLLNRLFCNNIPQPKPCLSPQPRLGAAARHAADGAPRAAAPSCSAHQRLLRREEKPKPRALVA